MSNKLTYKELEQERNELAAQVERLKHDRDDALALVIRYQSLLECAIRGEEIIVGDAILIGIDAELADEIEESFDESPKAALAALKAQWQAEGAMAAWLELKRMGMAQAGSKNVIQSLVKTIRQRAQEASNAETSQQQP